MNNNQGDMDFDSDFGKKYEAGIKIALPTYEQLFPLADSFLKTSLLLIFKEHQKYFKLKRNCLKEQ